MDDGCAIMHLTWCHVTWSYNIHTFHCCVHIRMQIASRPERVYMKMSVDSIDYAALATSYRGQTRRWITLTAGSDVDVVELTCPAEPPVSPQVVGDAAILPQPSRQLCISYDRLPPERRGPMRRPAAPQILDVAAEDKYGGRL